MIRTRMQKKKGFIVVYTVLILSIMVIVGGIFIETVLKEVSISRDEAESLKAFYAADTVVECVRYLQLKYSAFDTTTPLTEYNCGMGDNFQAGKAVPDDTCTNHEYNFTIDGFSNEACAIVTVRVTPRVINVSGSSVTVCDIDVISNGRNSCTATSKLVERTRWETI